VTGFGRRRVRRPASLNRHGPECHPGGRPLSQCRAPRTRSRNDIGHELFHIIADDDKNPIKLDDVLTTFGVYLKIVRWWVKEVEATTDPDFDQEIYDNANWDEVESCDTVFLREIIRKSLLSDAEWQEIDKHFPCKTGGHGR
jgi:hypothetical protein